MTYKNKPKMTFIVAGFPKQSSIMYCPAESLTNKKLIEITMGQAAWIRTHGNQKGLSTVPQDLIIHTWYQI